uniref:Uncharacterized protein n=1 Tax=Siphoviridae sp. ctJ3t72 TaxID=2826240 RepID=A0A8S5QMX3_9CAUD|nr:MAG TPA: hypothetical protein [Siphoviridae sp. ctJ3t72]
MEGSVSYSNRVRGKGQERWRKRTKSSTKRG